MSDRINNQFQIKKRKKGGFEFAYDSCTCTVSETDTVPCCAVNDFRVNVTPKSSEPAKFVTNLRGIGFTMFPFCDVVT